jgi:golgi phosphoprotein 3
MTRSLRLDQELLLLALHDRKGTHAFGSMMEIGLAGGIFTELVLAGHLRIATGAARRGGDLVEVVGRPPRTERLLLDAVERLEGSRRKAPKTAVASLARIKGIRRRVAEELCRKGVLREAEDRILVLFRRRIYPTVDPGPERDLVRRVRQALEGAEEPDERTGALIALASVTGTLRALATKAELKQFKGRIKAITEGSPGGSATREAVEAAQAAMAAVIATTTAASAATG